MTHEEVEELISSLESGHSGIEAFLELPVADRAAIMERLEQRGVAHETRRILEQGEADGTMDKVRAVLAEHQARNDRKKE